MILLKNKNVLVTGGSRGIGEACVRMFSNVGANIAFTYNTTKHNAEKIIRSITENVQVKSYQTDLNNPTEIEGTVKTIIQDFGSINILVNNAGIWKEADVDKMSLKEWDEMVRINLSATFLFCKYVIPEMKKNKSGRIINISSTAGQRGEAFHSHYAATKGGLISFTKSLAVELGEYNVTVNCVAPGWVVTDMTTESLADKKMKKKIVSDIPLKKIADPKEIAGPVLFLASDLASHITGEILNVNGGSVLCS
jgi:3-oxoacyl-[acyl-carrier protein] reductase